MIVSPVLRSPFKKSFSSLCFVGKINAFGKTKEIVFSVLTERNGTMNTFWLKIAGGAVGVVIVLIIVNKFFSGDDTPGPQEERRSITDTKSFARQVEEDRAKLSAEPQPITAPVPEPAPQTTAPAETQPAEPVVAPKPSIIYVKPMQEFEEIEAQRIWETAVPGRSIGRLPVMGYSLAIKGCKEIIQRWPDSKYAFMATRLLNDIPERRRAGVTEKEVDLSRFYGQRPGTQPMQVQESD